VRRVAGVAVMAVALISVVGYGFVQDPSTFAVLVGRLVLLALAVTLGRWAVRRTLIAAEPPAPPTAAVGGVPADAPVGARRPEGRPALIINLRSGGGKAERAHLVEACQSCGIVPIILRQGDDLQELARRAIDGGAPAIGMAGGDGSQALVATVAAEGQVPMVVVPAGTRNHLARDLGLARDDVVGALAAYTEGVERRMDLGMVGDRVFMNNVSLGLYASIVSSPEYRDAKVDTALSTLPKVLGPGSKPFDLRFTGPDGRRRDRAHLIQISNNPYGGGGDIGRRPRLDTGQLAIITLQIDGDRSAAAFLAAVAAGRPDRFSGFSSWTATTFEVDSDAEVAAGLDGESITLPPPLRFSIRSQALVVLLPPGAAVAPGASSAARVTLKDVGRVATGRPVVR
jgi:diacylglycerol kinase family enzyme